MPASIAGKHEFTLPYSTYLPAYFHDIVFWHAKGPNRNEQRRLEEATVLFLVYDRNCCHCGTHPQKKLGTTFLEQNAIGILFVPPRSLLNRSSQGQSEGPGDDMLIRWWMSFLSIWGGGRSSHWHLSPALPSWAIDLGQRGWNVAWMWHVWGLLGVPWLVSLDLEMSLFRCWKASRACWCNPIEVSLATFRCWSRLQWCCPVTHGSGACKGMDFCALEPRASNTWLIANVQVPGSAGPTSAKDPNGQRGCSQ